VPRSAGRPARGRRICSATAHQAAGNEEQQHDRASVVADTAPIAPRSRPSAGHSSGRRLDHGKEGAARSCSPVPSRNSSWWSGQAGHHRASAAADRIRRPRLSHALGEAYQRFATSGPRTPKRPAASAASPSSTASLPPRAMKRNPTGGDRGRSGLVSARTAPSLHVRLDDNRVRRSSHHAVVRLAEASWTTIGGPDCGRVADP
jgi:hypothetical protein